MLKWSALSTFWITNDFLNDFFCSPVFIYTAVIKQFYSLIRSNFLLAILLPKFAHWRMLIKLLLYKKNIANCTNYTMIILYTLTYTTWICAKLKVFTQLQIQTSFIHSQFLAHTLIHSLIDIWVFYFFCIPTPTQMRTFLDGCIVFLPQQTLPSAPH